MTDDDKRALSDAIFEALEEYGFVRPVLCWECKWSDEGRVSYVFCRRFEHTMDMNGWCSEGEEA